DTTLFGSGGVIGPRAVPGARAAGAAKKEVGSVAAFAGELPHFRPVFAFDADLLRGKAHLRGKGAAAARLALAAMAHRDPDRLARTGDTDLAAAASGAASHVRHFAAFLSATRTRASSVAPAPSSSFAAATAPLASVGLKPRLVSAATASPSGPEAGVIAEPVLPARPPKAPALSLSSYVMRWASFGPTPLARAIIALSPPASAR